MTEKNKSHARRVTVSRVGENKPAPEKNPAPGRKVVAVRLKGDPVQPRPTNAPADEVLTAEAEAAEEVMEEAAAIPAEPAAEAPAADNSSAAPPEAAEPEVPESENTEPEETEPESTEPETEPESTEPEESAEEAEPPENPDAPEESSETEAIPDPAGNSTPCPEAIADPAAVSAAEPDPVRDSCESCDCIDRSAAAVTADTAVYAEAESKDAPSPAPAGKWYIPQKLRDISLPRKIVMALSAALFLLSCLPLLVGVISPGILPPVMIAAFFFLCALYWPLIDGCESTWGNVLIAVVAVCVLAGVTYLSFVSGKMISASANTLPENRSDVTVVVLGCKIHGDRPSRMLHARLEAAADFLLEHPQAHCVVTGGQGEDEDYPEAFVMKNYLVDKGVSPMRIVMEPNSTSTLENIIFSAEMAEKYNCHERFLIVTDRFHQYRAMRTANDLGIVSYALNVETAWYLAVPYWFREMAAITRDWIVS